MTSKVLLARGRAHWLLGGLTLLELGTGCASTITVTRVTKEKNTEIRTEGGLPYYLPKPYLIVAKNIAFAPPQSDASLGSDSSGSGADSSGQGTGAASRNVGDPAALASLVVEEDVYTMHLVYLPNLAERHELNVHARSGNFSLNVSLKDGWQLAELSFSSDSQTDETIQAAAEFVKALSPAFTAGPAAGGTNANDVLVKLLGTIVGLKAPPSQETALTAQPPRPIKDRRMWVFEFDLDGASGKIELRELRLPKEAEGTVLHQP